MSDNWQFPNLAGVWEYRTRAIVVGGDTLDAMAEPERDQSLEALRERVRMQARALDDGWLVATAYFMVEDLYKSYFCDFRWTPGVVDYIAATAGTVTEELRRRGFVLHYVISNTQGEAHLEELLTYVPATFNAAGLFVVSPQLMALQILEQDGAERDVALVPRTLAEGHYLADRLMTRCHEERRSYVYLNIELDDGSPALPLDVALSQRDTPGTIVVFRSEAPISGTEAIIAPPPGVTFPLS